MTVTFDAIQGQTYISVDLLDRALARIGVGPVLTCLGLETIHRLDAAGEFTASFAHNDPTLFPHLSIKNRVLRFYLDSEHAFTGIIEEAVINLENTGQRIVTVRGRDLAAELAESPVGFLELSTGTSGGPVTIGPASILNVANAFNGHTWTLDTTSDGFSTTISPGVYAKFAGESALQALVMLGEKIGEHFRVSDDGTRKMVWLRKTYPASGVYAIGGAGEPVQAETDPYQCFIQSFSESSEGYELATRVYPYGGGTGDTRLTLAATSRTAPAGYTLNKVENYIESTNAATELDANIGIYREFKDIRPISNTDADVVSAANALFDATLEYLRLRDSLDDVKTYTLAAIGVSSRIKAGRTIRVDYQDDLYVVAADLVVLEIHNRVNEAGAKLSSLTVSPVPRRSRTGDSTIVGELEQGKIFSAHPQTGPSAYTISYRLYIGWNQLEHKADMRFWFGDEVVQIQRVLWRFRIGPVVNTSVSLATVSSEASSASTTEGGSAHSHAVEMTSHTHAIPNHDHRIGLGQGSGGRNVGIFTGGVLYYEGTNIGVLTHDTEADSGATTSGDGGGTAETSDSESSHTHDMPHTHIITPDTEFGLFQETVLNTYNINGMEYSVNGSGFTPLNAATIITPNEWYEIDITEDVSVPMGAPGQFRPASAINTIEVRHNGREITSVSGTGATVTVNTATNHGLATGQKATISGTTNYNGTWTVTVVDSDTFTFAHTATPAESTGMIFTHKTVMMDAFLSIRQIIQSVQYL